MKEDAAGIDNREHENEKTCGSRRRHLVKVAPDAPFEYARKTTPAMSKQLLTRRRVATRGNLNK